MLCPRQICICRSTWRTTGLAQESKTFAYPDNGEYTHVIAYLSIQRKYDPMGELTLSILFVLLSYLGFWINPAAVPARVARGIITVLVVSGLRNALKSQLPPFSYHSWLTDFMFGSMLFNVFGFGALCLVNLGITVHTKLSTKEKAKKQKTQEPSAELGELQEV